MGNREDLEKLKTDISKDAPDIGERFNGIAKRMGEGGIWYGTQANDFSTDLDGEKSKLSSSAGELKSDVNEQLENLPEDEGE